MQMQIQLQMIQMMNGQNTTIAAYLPIYQWQNNNQRRECQQQLQQSWGMSRLNRHPQGLNFVQPLDGPLKRELFLDRS